MLIHQDPHLAAEQGPHAHQIETVEQDVDHGEHQHRRQIVRVDMAPYEPDNYRPHHHVAQAGQQHPGGHLVVEDDAPAEDQQVDQHEEGECPPVWRLPEEALDGEWHQGEAEGDEQVGQPDPRDMGKMPA